MGWLTSCTINGRLFNQGDQIICRGQSYANSGMNNADANYTTDQTFYFCGYYEGGKAPVAVSRTAGSLNNIERFFAESSVVGGGVKIGTAVAKPFDNRNNSYPNTVGWFEGLSIQWSGFSAPSNNPITDYHIYYRECKDGGNTPDGNWSNWIGVTGNAGTGGSYGLASVDQSNGNQSSNWGARGYWYQFCVIGILQDGNNTGWGCTTGYVRKCLAYKQTFDANGGSGAPLAQYKFINYDFVFPSTIPTREGYTFIGWNSSKNGADGYAANQRASTANGEVTWYAIWKPKDYTLTLNANGGSIASDKSKVTVTYRTGNYNVINDRTPTKKGYTFAGWYTSKSDGTQVYDANGKAVDCTYWDGTANSAYWNYAGNVTLYAQWKANKYYVKYNANGGSGSMGSTVLEYGTATYLKANTFKRTGHKFSKWNTNSNGTGTSYDDKAVVGNLTSQNEATVNLYAIWEIESYTLTINPNGGSWGGKTGETTVSQEYGSEKTIANPRRTGYKFEGWELSGSGSISGTTYTYGAGSCTLTAKWSPNSYTLTLNANGGSVETDSVDVTYNSGDYFDMSWNIPTYPGCTFIGWYTAESGGTKVYDEKGYCINDGTYWSNASGSSQWKYAGDVTLYAQWKVEVYTDIIQHYLFGDEIRYLLGESTFYTKHGFYFELDERNAVDVPNGCSLSPSFLCCRDDALYEMGSPITQTAETLTFEYYYTPNEYKITYDLVGGTNHIDNPSTYNVLYGVSLKNPTKDKAKFLGWYIDDEQVTGINEGCNAVFNSAKDLYNKLAARTTGDLVIKAKWLEEVGCCVFADGAYQEGELYIWSESDGGYVSAKAEIYKMQNGTWVLTKE